MAIRNDFELDGQVPMAVDAVYDGILPAGTTTDRPVKVAQAQASIPPATITIELEDGNVARLPADADIANVRANGADLEFVQPDGSVIVVPGGAIANLVLFLGDVQIPAETVELMFTSAGIEPAAGPEGGEPDGTGSYVDLGEQHVGEGFRQNGLLSDTGFAFAGGPGLGELGNNTVPEFPEGGIFVRLSEEGLEGGNKDDDSFPDDQTNQSQVLGIPFGLVDAEGNDLNYTILGIPAGTWTSGGTVIEWDLSPDGTILVGRAGEMVIIEVSFDNAADTYTVTLSGPFDHLDPDSEDTLDLVLPIRVADFQNFSDSTLTLTIEDDSPELSGKPAELVVDEDDIWTTGSLGSSPNDGDSIDKSFTGQANNGGAGPANATGKLAEVVKAGADDGLTYGFLSDAAVRGFMTQQGLTSEGKALSYQVVGNTLYAFENQAGPGGLIYNEGQDRLVFTLEVNPTTGSFTFSLHDQLDHDKTSHDTTLPIDFGGALQAIDYDKDPITLTGKVTVNVTDDTPYLSGAGASLTVDEDDIRTTGSLGSSPNDGNSIDKSFTGPAGDNGAGPANATGTLAGLVATSGADDGLTYGFLSDAAVRGFMTQQGLTSEGKALSYEVVGNTLYAFENQAGPGGLIYNEGQDRLVFTLEVNPTTGSFTFSLHDQLDHDKTSHDTTLPIDFGGALQAIDYDKDTVTLTGKVTVNVTDDNLIARTGTTATVEDEAVNGGNDETESPDILGSVTNVSLNITWGADGANDNNGQPGDRSVAFTNALVAVTGAHGATLSSQGAAVHTAILSDGTLIGYTGSPAPTGTGSSRIVFFATVSDASDTGSYSFTLKQPLDHADDVGNGENTLSLTFTYTAIDADGDSSSNTFTVDVVDDVPRIGTAETETVREVDLPYIPFVSEIAPWPDTAGSLVQSGNLAISWGADNNDSGSSANRLVAFAATLAAPVGLTSDGEQVSYSFNADRTVLTATAGNGIHTRIVFSVSLDDDASGSYTFRLFDNIDHMGEDGASKALTFDFVAQDADGDTAAAAFVVNVIDETPGIGDPETETADEDGLSGGNAGGFGDASGAGTSESGDLEISWGADNNDNGSTNNRSVVFSGYTNGDDFGQLTSDGDAVKVWVSADGTTLYGYVGTYAGAPATTPPGGSRVFTVTLNDDGSGSYQFTLHDNLDHPGHNHPGTPATETSYEDEIDLVFAFTATDSDLDTVSDTFRVSVDDDTPRIGDPEDESVNEDDLSTGNDANKEPLLQTGDLDLDWGADSNNAGAADRALAFTTLIAPLNLTSNGVTVNYWVSTDGTKLVAYRGSGATSEPGAADKVFEVTLSDADGSYAFTLIDRIDHATGNGENGRALNFGFSASDSDGDRITSSFDVTIYDDVPMSSAIVQSATVYENELPTGTTPGAAGDANGDGNALDWYFTGNLSTLVSMGADRPGTYLVETTNLASTFSTLTSGGVQLQYSIGADNTLVAKAGTQTVFEFQVDPTTGQYSFRLMAPLDHGNSSAVMLDVSTAVTVRDFDGDLLPLSGQINITISDDGPKAPNSAAVTAASTASEDGPPLLSDVALGIQWGADDGNDNNGQPGDRAVAFSSLTPVLGGSGPVGTSLSSSGAPVLLAYLNGDTTKIVAYTGSPAPTTGTGSNIVFLVTLSDAPTGSYRFDLRQPLDHPDPDEVNNLQFLDLTFAYSATDSDGDSDPGAFTVRVDASGTIGSIHYDTLPSGVLVNLADIGTAALGGVIGSLIGSENAAANTATDRASVADKVVGIDSMSGVNDAYGSSSADILIGGNESNLLSGGAGNDLITGGKGGDQLFGGADDDAFVLAADVTGSETRAFELGDGTTRQVSIAGLAGTADQVSGGTGYDAIILDRESTSGYVHDTYSAPSYINGVEKIVGTDGGDIILVDDAYMSDAAGGGILIEGGAGNDSLGGGAGTDTILGGDNDDLISGLGGADTLEGGAGSDEIWGGVGADTLKGDAGNDRLIGGADNDTIEGGSGDDLAIWNVLADGTDSFAGGANTDTLRARVRSDQTSVNSFELWGTAAAASIKINNPSQTTVQTTTDVERLELAIDNNHSNTFESFSGGANAVQIIASGAAADGTALGLGQSQDIFRAGASHVTDEIDARGGNDFAVYTTVSNATGGSGVEINLGTQGYSVGDIDIAANTAQFVLDGATRTDHLYNFENAEGGQAGDILVGSDGANQLRGNEGNDTLIGRGGADTLIGDAGNDRIVGGTELLANGGFNGPSEVIVGNGTQLIELGGGWTIASGNVDLLFVPGSLNAEFPAGVNAVDMQGMSNGTITQDFATVVGQTYTVTFLQSTNPGVLTHTADTTSAVMVSAGLDSATFTHQASGDWNGLASTFVERTFTFTATQTTTTLTIAAVDGSGPDYYGSLIANVSVISADPGSDAGDTITGGAGNDVLSGGVGDDSIDGGDDDDILSGGAGTDTLTGGAGDDFMAGGAGDDSVSGGSGDDTVSYVVGEGVDTVDAGADTDTLNVYGDDVAQTFHIETAAVFLARTGGTIAGEIGIANGDNASDLILDVDNVEEIVVNGGGGGDTFAVAGDFGTTSLATSTLHIDAGDGTDTLDLTGLVDTRRVVSDGGAASDTVKLGFDWANATFGKIFNAQGGLIGANVTINGVTHSFTNYETFIFDGEERTLAEVFNVAPESTDSHSTGNEDSVFQVTLTATDPDGNQTGFVVTSAPANGTLYLDAGATQAVSLNTPITGASPLTLYFKPDADWNGTTEFEYAARDKFGLVDATPATGEIEVLPVNDAPVVDLNGAALGQDVTVTSTENLPQYILSGATLTDVDSDNMQSLTVRLTTLPNGSAVEGLSLNPAATAAAAGLTVAYVAATGTLTVSGSATTLTYQTILNGIVYQYTGDNPTGGDRIVTVVVNDGLDDSITRTATIHLNPSNDPPVLTGDLTATVVEGGTHVLTQADLFYNDPDNSEVSFTVSDQVGGIVYLQGVPSLQFTSTQLANGDVTFVHDGNENPSAGFKVKLEDGNQDGSPAVAQTFTFNVAAVNDPPVAVADTYTTAEDTPLQVTFPNRVTVNDTDAENNALSAVLQTNPAHGTLSFTGAGTFLYTPDANFNGTDSFTYLVTDGSGVSNVATVTINVTAINDAPTLAPVAGITYMDTSGNDDFAASGGTLVGSDVDTPDTKIYSAEGSAPSGALEGYDLAKAGTYGTLYVNSSSGAYTYVPNDAAINGLTGTTTEQFTLRVKDGSHEFGMQPLVVTLNGANDTPTISTTLASTTYTDTAGNDTFANVDGQLSSTDRDTSDGKSYSIDGTTSASGLTGFNVQQTGAYGVLHLNVTTGAYRYVPNDGAIEALNTGTSESFVLRVTDTGGLSATQGFVVNINAVVDASTNHAPVLAVTTSADLSFEDGFAGWETFGSVTRSTSLHTDGDYSSRIVTGALDATTLESQLGLASGSLSGLANEYSGSAEQIQLQLAAGQTVTFDWYFSTSDSGGTYNDFAFFSDGSAVQVLADVDSLGGSSNSGWHTYSFTATAAGIYDLSFGVFNVGDNDSNFGSRLYIDNLGGIAQGGTVLTAIAEDAGIPVGAVGTLVSALVDLADGIGADNVSDVDPGAVTGIALTGVDATHGTWWFSLDNGGSWSTVGTVSDTQALLLTPTARLYFQPDANWNGTLDDAVSYRAWDQTGGAAGSKVDSSVNGGTTALSIDQTTSPITVTPVNDNPVANNDVLSSGIGSPLGTGWILNSDNGHYYKVVADELTWQQAQEAAQAEGGYLATITSEAEKDFIQSISVSEFGYIAQYAWIGATDAGAEGVWKWVGGAEDGMTFWNGDENGSAPVGAYENWGVGEPNDDGGNEDYGMMFFVFGGGWNDGSGNVDAGTGYVAEFGGVTFDPQEDTPFTIDAAVLLANDTDIDGDTLTISSVQGGVNGTVSMNGTTITFTPTADYSGAASFTYTVTDGHGGTSTATVSFVIAEAGQPPTDIVWNAVNPGSGLPNSNDVIANLEAIDPDSSSGFTYTLLAGSSSGVTVSSAGVVTKTSGAMASNETYTLNIQVADSTGATYSETFDIITGSSSGNTIPSGGSGSAILSGDDIEYGRGGDDTIYGGDGNDTLFGQDGNDTLKGGGANDVMDGGAGTDLLDFSDATAAINFTLSQSSGDTVADLTAAGLGSDTYRNMEGVTGSGFADTLNGSSSADTISGGAGADTITGGAGADSLNGGTGAANTFGYAAGHSSASVSGTTVSGYDVISGFRTSGGTVDKLDFGTTPVRATDTTGINGTNASAGSGGGTVTVRSHAISNGMITFSTNDTYGTASLITIDSATKFAAVVKYLQANSIGSAGASAAFVSSVGGTHTFVYQQIGASPDTSKDLLIDLAGVTLTAGGTSLKTLFDAAKIDPIILDLDHNGFNLAAGTHFDLNHDGQPDHLGWPGPGDGILVVDLDNSGAIENGNEVFSPDFGTGGHKDSLAALATFDSNGDGKITADDAGFGDLKVWQDANGDGITDAGELSGLSDLGVVEIDLGADEVDYNEDGQHVFAAGTFKYADGESGDFIGVDLGAPGETHVGTDAADVFVIDDLDAADLIADFDFGGDKVDLSSLLDGVTAENAAQYVKFDGTTLSVDTDGTGAGQDFKEVATFSGQGDHLTVTIDTGFDVIIDKV